MFGHHPSPGKRSVLPLSSGTSSVRLICPFGPKGVMGTMRKMTDTPTMEDEKVTGGDTGATTEVLRDESDSAPSDSSSAGRLNGHEQPRVEPGHQLQSGQQQQVVQQPPGQQQQAFRTAMRNGKKRSKRLRKPTDVGVYAGRGNGGSSSSTRQVNLTGEHDEHGEQAGEHDEQAGHQLAEEDDGDVAVIPRECPNGGRSSSDVPMDLSKRSADGASQRKFLEPRRRLNGGGVAALASRTVTDESDDVRMTAAAEEPLNLSINTQTPDGAGQSPASEGVQRLACPSTHPLFPAVAHGPGSHGGAAASESLQKRVRLEEMVSYLRRCSDGRKRRGGQRSPPPSFHESAADFARGGRRLRQAPGDDDGAPQCVWEDGLVTSSATDGATVGEHVRHSSRRKGSVPNRGIAMTTTNAPSQCSKRPRGLPTFSDDVPKDLRTSYVTTAAIQDGGSGGPAYPVLRQQLLSLELPRGSLPPCRRPGGAASGGRADQQVVVRTPRPMTSLRRSRNDNGGAENEWDLDASEYHREGRPPSEDEDDVTDAEEEDVDDDGGGGGILAATPSPGLTPASRFPWTAYAYYANLFQELQGSLTSASGMVAPPSAIPLAFPLSLTLIPSSDKTDSGAASPQSDCEDGPDGVAASSPLTSGKVVVDCCGGGTGSGGTGTNPSGGIAAFRKRAPRALTGKHVKHGTGASPATLLTLRQKIEQKRKQQQQQQQVHHHHRNHPHHHQGGKNGQSATSLPRTDRKSADGGLQKTLKSLSQKKLQQQQQQAAS